MMMPFDPISTHSNATPSLNSEPQWTPPKVLELFQKGLIELLWEAQHIHRQHHPADEVELATLLSIKTGSCPENCSYCPQSQHFETGIHNDLLLAQQTVRQTSQRACDQRARCFCMGTAWRSPTEKQHDEVITMIQKFKTLGLETCVTLGMLKQGQAER